MRRERIGLLVLAWLHRALGGLNVSIPYSRPRGAIPDLAHLETLSACRQRLLCVSDRTLYLLRNLAGTDIEFLTRSAEESPTDGYVPVSEGSPNFDLFVSAYEAFQLEVLDMTCDIQAET